MDLRAVGDIMLGRLVATIGRQRGFDYPFAQARSLLTGDQVPIAEPLAIGNLESPLTDRRGPLRPGPYRLPAPAAFAAPLRAAGFRALGLANNHALDIGPLGLQDAASALNAAGIASLGAGPDAQAARAPTIDAVGGLRVALLAFNDVRDPQDQPSEGQGEWGRAWLGEAALDAVRSARGQADLVVVLVHWGHEYETRPSDRQREWAHRLAAAGADVVVGAHPHVLQPVESIAVETSGNANRTTLVAYSLGNFVFDQGDSPATSTSAALRVLLDRQGVALAAAAPVETAAGQARPLPLDSSRARAALASLVMTPPPASSPARGGDQKERWDGFGKAETVPTLLKSPHSPTGSGRQGGEGNNNPESPRAWSWDGRAGHELAVPDGARLAARPNGIPADLRGDGRPLWVSLDARGVAQIHDGDARAPVVWRNEAADWRVARVDAGDLDGDGRIELALLLWRPEPDGRLRSHPFLVGWRGGRYRVLWGGSATATPIQDLAVGDLDGDGRQELVVLAGGQAPGDAGETVSVWRWSGWMFELAWRSAPGHYSGLALQDVNGDGRPDIVTTSI